MNVKQKGSFTVIIATLITSITILVMGSSVADNQVVNQVGIEANSSSDVIASKDNSTAVTASQTLVEKKNNKSGIALSIQGRVPQPPPGPFFNTQIKQNNVGVPSHVKHLVPPAAPTQPVLENVSDLIDKPPAISLEKKPSEIKFIRMRPSLEQVAKGSIEPPLKPAQPKQEEHSNLSGPIPMETNLKERMPPKQPNKLVVKPIAPKQKKREFGAPDLDVNREPVWMQKELLQKMAPPIQPVQPRIGRQLNDYYDKQNNERAIVQPTQRYIFIPAPTYYPNYAYPQMPMPAGATGMRQPPMMPMPSYNPYYQPRPRLTPKGINQ